MVDFPQPLSPTRAVKLPCGNCKFKPWRISRPGSLLFVFRQIQQAEDLVAGGHAVHGDVEEGAELPHRKEEIRCQQDDQQAAG